MYVYIKSEHNLWTVGFYAPDGKWHPESDYNQAGDAAERVHYLNGGEMPENPYILHGEELERASNRLLKGG